MELKPEVKKSLEKIDFISRYKKLYMKYSFSSAERFKSYDNSLVMDLFGELGYKVSFNKKENFFKFIEQKHSYKFQVNISLKAGHTEIIWALWRNEALQIGIPWILLKTLMGDSDQNIKYPIFRNYEDLKMILKESFLMYEDFKEEILLIYEHQVSDS
ncbi:hypothetical protein [Saccharibacillus sacchari]|uniref:hypothetical protein n=1 Tax=Saccharibacillus sacchari TaxID=456493 RepID=UPI000686C9A5|nr:hypothetical protein [Saccharibacillus sacchari]